MTTVRSLTRRLTCRIAAFVAEFEDIEDDWIDHCSALESAVTCSQVEYVSDPTICMQPQFMSVADIRIVAGRFALRLIEASLASDRDSPAVVRLKSLLPAFDRGFVKQLTPARSRTGRARHIENSHATRDVLVGMCVDELWTHRIIKKVGLGVRLTDSIFSDFRRECGITPSLETTLPSETGQGVRRPITRGLDLWDEEPDADTANEEYVCDVD